jgi:transcriptional regulator with XRE-family HTH domain
VTGQRAHNRVMRIGDVLRRARESQELSQEALAAMSGVAQSVISAYERDRRQPSWVAAERLFAEMGLQMRIELEPLDADLDRQIDAYAAMTAEERLRELPYCLKELDGHFGGIPLVVTGAAAAALQGAPVPVRRVDLLILDEDAALDAFCAQLGKYFSRLWQPEREWWAGSLNYPEVLREHRTTLWMYIIDQIHVTLVDELPQSVTVVVGEATVPVLPLHELELTDPEAARLLARLRERRRAIS